MTVATAAAALDRALAKEQRMIDRCLAALEPGRPRRRRSRSRRRFWAATEDRKLRRLYPDTPTAALARRLKRSLTATYGRAMALGLHKSAAYLASPAAYRFRRGDHPGAAYWYPKGHVPANKGLRRPGWAPGRMAETQFKKGQLNGVARQRWVPVGTGVRDTDGYLKRKVADERTVPSRFNWRSVHILVWEAQHGPVPRGSAVAFKNGDKTDTREENLELVSRQELMRRNSVHNLPPALAKVIQLRGALVRQIRKRATA